MIFQNFFVKVLTVFLVVALASGCTKTYVGQGETISDVRQVGRFNKLVINMNAIVKVKDTAVNFCIINAQENLQEAIVTRIDGSTLVITEKGTIVSDNPVEILIGLSEAAAFEVNGSAELTGLNTIKNESFDFEVNGSGAMRLDVVAVKITGAVSGSGAVTLTGSSNDLNVEINGSGIIDAQNFNTLRSKARISGSGEVKLFVAQSLEVNVGGSGIVRYRGNAVVEKKISGSGEVIKLD